MFGGGRSFIHSILVTGVDEVDDIPEESESGSEPEGGTRRNASLEIRITGNLELLVDSNRLEVT